MFPNFASFRENIFKLSSSKFVGNLGIVNKLNFCDFSKCLESCDFFQNVIKPRSQKLTKYTATFLKTSQVSNELSDH